MYETDTIFTSVISTFIYCVIALSCFRYFNFSKNIDTTLEDEERQLQKHKDLQLLKNEIETIQIDFQNKFEDAVRGKLKKR